MENPFAQNGKSIVSKWKNINIDYYIDYNIDYYIDYNILKELKNFFSLTRKSLFSFNPKLIGLSKYLKPD